MLDADWQKIQGITHSGEILYVYDCKYEYLTQIIHIVLVVLRW